ncbi:conjugal transfer protein TraO [Dyadobacter frigoris]|uniref:conjugal transfer protein TraO n=1 Tax=Dyadobacter frigoris TaxID=2576211 RepID=UPI0024A1C652|nr:conjugal transfer protein TraO [Dyadobacter frigoris]GLU56514.1 conjugal transfer protein TraO [Dyadobacter frigoris]
MKHIKVTILIMCLTVTCAFSQVHVKGTRFVDISAGTVDGVEHNLKKDNSGFWISLGTGKYNKFENSWRWNLDYLQKNYVYSPDGLNTGLIPVRHYSVQFGHGFKLLKSKRRVFYLNAIPQLVAGYESVNNNVSTAGNYHIDNRNKFLIGGMIGIEIEIENFTIQAKQRWLPTSSTKIFHTQLGIGYRFNR